MEDPKNANPDYDQWYDEDDDDYFDAAQDYEDELEMRYDEQCEYASACKCGAWQFNSKGEPVHVADCCCGAE